MSKKIIAAAIALAITAGNIAATEAGTLRLKAKQGGGQPVATQFKATPAQPKGPDGFVGQQFNPVCVTGFQKFGQKTANVANVPVISEFSCRTGWIECPQLPAFSKTILDVNIEETPTANEGKKIRITYTCWGYTPEG